MSDNHRNTQCSSKEYFSMSFEEEEGYCQCLGGGPCRVKLATSEDELDP